MNKILILFLVLLYSFELHAEELLAPLPLASTSAGTMLDDGTLRVDARQDRPMQLLIEIEQPGVTSSVYALKGMVRYDAIEGTAFLQMDNHFPGKGVYFTKSLADAGPLARLTGSSGWREFVLPFHVSGPDASGDSPLTPDRLSLSLQLPESGTVLLRDLALYQYEAGEDPLRDGAWLDDRTMGLVGGIGGSVIGLWGALAGVLAGRGRARSFVIGSANALIILGVAFLAAGVFAAVFTQPYSVYFTLFLFGGLLVFIVGGLRSILPQRYEAIELKKMQSMDV